MGKGFSVTLLGSWLSPSDASSSSFLQGLAAHEKLLLFSEGSMTLELELLTGKRIDVELRLMGERPLDKGEAGFLGVKEGDPAMEREVWLLAGGERLLYAHTLIPLECIDRGVKEALDQMSSEPLGRVLTSKGVLFAKERLEAGLVLCEAASVDLGLSTESALYARRYILYNRSGAGWVIKAVVTEVFSPRLVSGAGAAR